MPMPPREIAKLRKIVQLAQQLLAKQDVTETQKRKGKGAKTVVSQAIKKRRSGKELASFRKMLKAERKQGVAVAEIARRHGVSLAYIYQLK